VCVYSLIYGCTGESSYCTRATPRLFFRTLLFGGIQAPWLVVDIRTPDAGVSQVTHANSPHYVPRTQTYIQSSSSSFSVLCLWRCAKGGQVMWPAGKSPTCVLTAHSASPQHSFTYQTTIGTLLAFLRLHLLPHSGLRAPAPPGGGAGALGTFHDQAVYERCANNMLLSTASFMPHALPRQNQWGGVPRCWYG